MSPLPIGPKGRPIDAATIANVRARLAGLSPEEQVDVGVALLASVTTVDARKHAHAAVLAALSGDEAQAQDVLAGATRNRHMPAVALYMTALTAWSLTQVFEPQVAPQNVVPAIRHLLNTLEKGNTP